MGWAFREFIHKVGLGINPNPACSAGMDVAFILDYTGSMGGVIDTVKSAVGDIVAAIDAEVGAGNYRLGLVISDEYTSTTANYSTSPDYISLPGAQKNINAGLGGKFQHNTAMALFDTNNEVFFTDQLNILNTPLPGFPLGNGQNTPEPTDMAIDLVINSDFLNPFRVNVAKYILLFTDATPGGNDDTYNGTDDAKVAALTADCIAAGIKVIVIGAGASQTVWQDLATNTGGAYNVSYDSEVIISQIVASCQELEPPLADAGVDQLIELPTDSVNVDGSGSSDSDGVITTYLWEKISGGAATITNPNNAMTSITGLEEGSYVFRLTVTDDDGLVDTDFLTVQVDPVPAIPAMTLGTTSVLVAWTPPQPVSVSSGTLTWDVTGGVTDNQVANTPTFDLSSNSGTADMVITDASLITGLSLNTLDIEYIDVTEAINLTTLDFFTNNVSTLDVTNNVNLTFLRFNGNNISTIDISNNPLLTTFACSDNNLTVLDVSANVNLVNLSIGLNNISVLDVSTNVDLELLQVSDMNLSDLDISNNPLITTLSCNNNSLPGTVLDDILIQLDTNGLSGGTIIMDIGRTAASDAARTSLLGKGWTINEV